MSGPAHFVQLVDLEKYHSLKDGKLIRNEQEVDRGEMCYFATPWDSTSYCRWYRVLRHTGDSRTPIEVLAHTMELDLFTFGVKVFVRIGRDGTLKVITEDSDGRETIASYKKDK